MFWKRTGTEETGPDRIFMTVTIDGEDAKDLDDASFPDKGGRYLYHLGVHIADVSNYVQGGSAIGPRSPEKGHQRLPGRPVWSPCFR